MTTLKDRLERALDAKPGATKASLARHCGITKTSVGAWFSGKAKSIDGQNLIRASAYLGVRPEWLASGRGPMHQQPGANATPSVAPASDAIPLSGEIHTRRLPLMRWEQVGEIETMGLESLTPAATLESPFESAEDSYLLEVTTEPMLPEYRPGEIIQVERTAAARPGDDVIVLLPNKTAIFRRLTAGESGSMLTTLNPKWHEQIVPMPEGASVVGVVVASWMRRRK